MCILFGVNNSFVGFGKIVVFVIFMFDYIGYFFFFNDDNCYFGFYVFIMVFI